MRCKLIFFLHRHAFLCNLLTEIMRPRFGDPINSAEDMVEKNITLIADSRVFEQWKNVILELNYTEWDFIAENMIPVSGGNWTIWTNFIRKHIIEKGTHALLEGNLKLTDLRAAPMEKWWKSKEAVIPNDSPYAGSVTARKWILNEVLKRINTNLFI